MEESTTVDISFDINDVYLIYQSVNKHLEVWPGGHPGEQERLVMMKDFLYRIVLEYKLNHM